MRDPRVVLELLRGFLAEDIRQRVYVLTRFAQLGDYSSTDASIGQELKRHAEPTREARSRPRWFSARTHRRCRPPTRRHRRTSPQPRRQEPCSLRTPAAQTRTEDR